MGADFILAITEKPREDFQETWKDKIRGLTASDLAELEGMGCPLIPDLDDLDEEWSKRDELIRNHLDQEIDLAQAAVALLATNKKELTS